jgi:hypothetical protein
MTLKAAAATPVPDGYAAKYSTRRSIEPADAFMTPHRQSSGSLTRKTPTTQPVSTGPREPPVAYAVAVSTASRSATKPSASSTKDSRQKSLPSGSFAPIVDEFDLNPSGRRAKV